MSACQCVPAGECSLSNVDCHASSPWRGSTFPSRGRYRTRGCAHRRIAGPGRELGARTGGQFSSLDAGRCRAASLCRSGSTGTSTPAAARAHPEPRKRISKARAHHGPGKRITDPDAHHGFRCASRIPQAHHEPREHPGAAEFAEFAEFAELTESRRVSTSSSKSRRVSTESRPSLDRVETEFIRVHPSLSKFIQVHPSR